MDLSKILAGTTAEENNSGDALMKDGRYNVVIEKIDTKQNDKGWCGLNFQLRVRGPVYDNKVMFELVTIQNPNSPQSVEIGLARLKKISELCGTENGQEMLGKRMCAVVGHATNKKTGAAKNRIWGFSEVEAQDNTPINNVANQAANIFGNSATITNKDVPF